MTGELVLIGLRLGAALGCVAPVGLAAAVEGGALGALIAAVIVAMGFAALLCAGRSVAGAWRAARAQRWRQGRLCPGCGYDRAGRRPCPECGGS